MTVCTPPLESSDPGRLAGALNQSCFCITLDRATLAREMEHEAGDQLALQIADRPHLFSNVPVFLPATDRDRMMGIVQAVERASATPGYRDSVLGWAPEASRQDFGPAGAFMGYDFHLAEGPPRLIEINTNAGGAFLNAFAARAQIACCDPVEPLMTGSLAAGFDDAVIAMFESEWRLQRGSGRPSRIAIVDNQPDAQYLHPEFLLAQALLNRRGFEAVIADPGDLVFEGGELRRHGRHIDLVYNRLVDFALDEPRHAVLRAAWQAGAVVVTPGPFNHALLADKRNLTLLSDPATLSGWGLAEPDIATLAQLPKAEHVTPDNAARLWDNRKHLFFKPVSGHGGKAVYRGDKLTRTVWASIQAAPYIAQELAPPGERQIQIDGTTQPCKMDVRLYTYRGQLMLAAARLYQGQTTNFRTPGGGFAPVYFL